MIENLLNRSLPRSPRARELCRALEGRRVAVEVRGFARLVVESTGESLRISRDSQATADTELSGGPLSLLALAGREPEAVLQRGDVHITGDAELAQRFQELLALLKPDAEEELALAIGDVPAHQVGRFARAAAGWTRRAAETLTSNAAEYFSHEKRDLVSSPEGEQFLKGVDALREDVDRLEARLEALAREQAT